MFIIIIARSNNTIDKTKAVFFNACAYDDTNYDLTFSAKPGCTSTTMNECTKRKRNQVFKHCFNTIVLKQKLNKKKCKNAHLALLGGSN